MVLLLCLRNFENFNGVISSYHVINVVINKKIDQKFFFSENFNFAKIILHIFFHINYECFKHSAYLSHLFLKKS